MSQFYTDFVHSQEVLKVLSVGPQFWAQKCTIPFVFAHYGKVFLKLVTEQAQEPLLTWWIGCQHFLNIWKFYRFTNHADGKACMHFWENDGFIFLEGFDKLKCYFA